MAMYGGDTESAIEEDDDEGYRDQIAHKDKKRRLDVSRESAADADEYEQHNHAEYSQESQDDDDDACSTVVPLLDGVLYFGAQHALHYHGEGFQLAASESTSWNVLDANVKPVSDQCEVVMTGPCDFETAGAKATPRKFKVTFTVSEPPTTNGSNEHITKSTRGKSVIQHVEEDGKNDSKSSGLYYKVFGSQIESNGGDLMEFLGGFYPPSTQEEKVSLVCQVRMIPALTNPAAISAVEIEKAAPTAAAAAAAPSSAAALIDDEEDGDEDEEADEEVDYNELIALHEDAGISVDDLKKRYRDEAEDGSKPSGEIRATRSSKRKPPPPKDDDEDDYDGF